MIQKLCSRFVHTKHNGKYETIKFGKKIKKNLACFILKKYKHIRKKNYLFYFCSARFDHIHFGLGIADFGSGCGLKFVLDLAAYWSSDLFG